MSKQHPLTSKICEEIAPWPVRHPAAYDCMRAAADWQLEQVIEWLNETIFERGSSLEAVNIPEELEKAMRPTTTQENNK